MLFNSAVFLVFFPIVFILYWLLNNKKLVYQNVLLLLASYLFYGWWDYRFLGLIILSTFVDYAVGLKIAESDNKTKKKQWLWVSMVFNLGLLGFFKYYNFFVDSWVDAFSTIGYELDPWTVQIILPVGISFYTFQTMSYSLDIYRKQLEPTKDFIGFAAFVTFFPQLVAGPIERASNLLPQILKKRSFQYSDMTKGLKLVLWGMFKKVAIADQLAPIVNEIFDNYSTYSTGVLLLGAIYFAFQIYCDFSGYSDIAIGLGRMFGIHLMTNFHFPYFSRSIAEFWRRWHISLSTWFRDYLYIPLGGSKVGRLLGVRNVFIIFLVSGFWHGANWTFVAWGGIHALLFVPSFILGSNRKGFNQWNISNINLSIVTDLFRVLGVFLLVTLAWVFFRANNIEHAVNYLLASWDNYDLKFNLLNPYDNQGIFIENIYLLILLIIEYFLVYDFKLSRYRILRLLCYSIILILTIIAIQQKSTQAFIYFQF